MREVRQMRLYTSGLTYPEACQLSDDLKAACIDSNITTGALAINPVDDTGSWTSWSSEKQAEWLQKVAEVIGDRCSWSSELPLAQQLVIDRPAAKARLKTMGVEIDNGT